MSLFRLGISRWAHDIEPCSLRSQRGFVVVLRAQHEEPNGLGDRDMGSIKSRALTVRDGSGDLEKCTVDLV